MTEQTLQMKRIGTIHTPYIGNAPYQPVEDEGKFSIKLEPEYVEGLKRLLDFKYIYVIYHIDRITEHTLPECRCL